MDGKAVVEVVMGGSGGGGGNAPRHGSDGAIFRKKKMGGMNSPLVAGFRRHSFTKVTEAPGS